MKVDLIWSGIVYDKDRSEKCIWDACFSPDGKRLVVASDKSVIIYHTSDGSKLKVIKAHKGTVYCVSYAADGKRFASGSSDCTVIIWNNETLEGILKFVLNDAVQCLSFNPVSTILASGACLEFGLWSPDQKSIKKIRVSARVTCCSWTSDGQYLALGLFNGIISIRNRAGEEKVKIERSGGALSPVWTLQWNYNTSENNDILAVGDWSQKLTFYQLSGKRIIYPDGISDVYLTLKQRLLRGNIGKEISLGFDPCTVSWLQHSNYLLIGGSDNKVFIYTKDGIKLNQVFEGKSWIWSCKAAPGPENRFVTCGQDGTINYLQIQFLTIHGLYRDRYAFREGMTDVIIHHLVTDQKARIKCKDVVYKIAIYKNRLAIQFPDKVTIYQPQSDDPNDMQYRTVDKIPRSFDCNLMIVTTNHLIICDSKRLSAYSYSGVKEREWAMDSPIHYTKIIGGPPFKEGILIGQKNGQITKVYLDNHFPIQILKASSGIKCLDISLSRKKLGVIDDTNLLTVYDLKKDDILFQENGVHSLAWNMKNDDMICYAGESSMFIKASDYPSHELKETGLVVGFNGTKIYTLNEWTMKTSEIPQSAAMYTYIQRNEYEKAFRVACLGVTTSDWQFLGEEALAKMNSFMIAKKSFIRIKDPYYLQLINDIEDQLVRGERNNEILIGDIYAYQSNFAEAAKSYRQAKAEQKALEMYSDIRQFDQAKNIAAEVDPEETKIILAKQADWARSTKEHRSAATMYLEAGQFLKAIEIMKENNWSDMIIDLARKLDINQKEIIQKCAFYLSQMSSYIAASECYYKIGDIASVVRLYIEGRNWDEAFLLLNKYSEFKEKIYVAYSQWLAENDKFEEAQIAFHKAGMQNEAVEVLEKLTRNAVIEQRYNDASYYYWSLSMQCLEIAKEYSFKKNEMIKKFDEFQNKSDIYYVYHSIQRYMEEPFASHIPEAYFNMSRYLLHKMMSFDTPEGISKVVILFTLAKQGKSLGAYKMARYAYEKLHTLILPDRFKKSVQLNALAIRAKPFHDSEDILLMCYRCSTTNPLLNHSGNVCVNCHEPFIHSFISFETLPLVEFELEDGISDEEALKLIAFDPAPRNIKRNDAYKETKSSEVQSLMLNDEMPPEFTDDPFNTKLMSMDAGDTYKPVILDRETIKSIPNTEIIVLKWPPPLRFQYFRNVMSDVAITKCDTCLRLFHTDDYELQALQKGHCPFCRNALND